MQFVTDTMGIEHFVSPLAIKSTDAGVSVRVNGCITIPALIWAAAINLSPETIRNWFTSVISHKLIVFQNALVASGENYHW